MINRFSNLTNYNLLYDAPPPKLHVLLCFVFLCFIFMYQGNKVKNLEKIKVLPKDTIICINLQLYRE